MTLSQRILARAKRAAQSQHPCQRKHAATLHEVARQVASGEFKEMTEQ